MIRLYKEYSIGVKTLSEADLGWETSSSSQTHIGLSEQVLTFLPNNPEQRDGILIYNRSCSFVECAFSKIGNKRSTKVDSTTSNPVKSLVKQIRNIASDTNLKWYLVWFSLDNQVPVFWLINSLSDDYSHIKDITELNFQMKVFKASKDEFFKILTLIRTITKFDNIVSQKYEDDKENLLIAASNEHRTFVHLTLDFFRAKGLLDVMFPNFSTTENDTPIKVFKESRFNLSNMFMFSSVEEINRRNNKGRRWFTDIFPINNRDCYLYVDWYPGKDKKGDDNQLMIPDFVNLINDCYGSQYVYLNSQGTHELWLVNKPESFPFVNNNKDSVEEPTDVLKFKYLLEYFCAHLQYIVTKDNTITGYDKYLKKYIDEGTFKKSGQGYNGQNIQLQIQPWEQYKYGKVCIAVYGSSFKSYSTYLHWKGTGHNISANWDGDVITSLQLVEYKGNSEWQAQLTKFTMSELGLYDNKEPNDNVTKMYNAFVQMLESDAGIVEETNNSQIPFNMTALIDKIKLTGLIYTDNLIKRFVFSLMSKRFLILSGLAGSGKTQLALAFASAMVKNKEKQMCVVSVGADWTNREPLLGFPNALQQDKYVKPESGVLDLLIEANRPENENKPFFLILDEMNMSYVERYFADFLSAMESKEKISLWNIDEGGEEKKEIDGVPSRIGLPQNLFIIGTINVDETTYMFSPKVLDRANVIEFKISSDEMGAFLQEMREVDRDSIIGKAAGMGASFVELANKKDLEKDINAVKILQSFFVELKEVNAEFGYRSATEIFRFICQAKNNDDTEQKMTENEILDAAIVQKLLPKLHGSRKKLEPVLKKLWSLCFTGADKDLVISKENIVKAVFKESADKILRMYKSANDNGFTSFAEA